MRSLALEIVFGALVSSRALPFIRIIVSGVFLLSSLPKLNHPVLFLGDVYQYMLIGPDAATFVAILLPQVEYVLALALLAGVWLRGAFLLGITLFGTFSVAQASALLRGLEISCGCFGSIRTDLISYTSLFRTLLLMILCAVAVWLLAVEGRKTNVLTK